MMNVHIFVACSFVLLILLYTSDAACPDNCATCNEASSTCNTCESGYFLSSNTCQGCSSNCRTCIGSESYQCTGCVVGYFLLSNSCVKCSEKCTSCKHKTECFTCENYFYQVQTGGGNNNKCSSCGGNTGIQGCQTCQEGMFGTSCTNDCNLCRDSVCLKTRCAYGCIDGYYEHNLGGETICVKCDDGCLLCTGPLNACSLCDSGYYLLPGIGTCNTCKLNCVTCTDSFSNCEVCVSGRWGLACESNCSSGCIGNTCVKNSGICIDGCRPGYYINNDQHCIPCSYDLMQCPGFMCPDGHFVSNNKCVQCPNNCQNNTCNLTNGICKEGCTEGWRGHKCKMPCMGLCEVCERLTDICISCSKGLYGNSCNETCSKKCGNSNCDITGKCNDVCITGYEGDLCDQEQDQDEQGKKNKSTQNVAVIAGAAGGGTILVIIVVVIIWLRRRKSKSQTETQTALPAAIAIEANKEQGYIYAVPNKLKKTNSLQMNTESHRTSHNEPPNPLRLSQLDDQETDVDTIHVEEEIDDVDSGSSVVVNEQLDPTGDTYYNVAGLKRSRINNDKLREYVAKKTDLDFYKEFQKFPNGLTRPFTESRTPENIQHNRYRAIYPYDATRVVLHDGGSDYINASYIDGNNQPKAYIASLGPTKVTMAKFTLFWRMVWQEKVEKVVMLTNLVEGDKMKCEQYWPEVGNTERYGDVIVTCDSDDSYADFCVKRLTVSKNGDKRVLHHLHFTAWPDRSVPDDVTCLIEFRQKVENIKTTLGGPLVVHCSAGVGRTGTYIGLDMLAKEGKTEGSVDIFGCVMGMRGQRISMVQTLEQYRYLHDTVVHVLTLDSDAVSPDTFHSFDRDDQQKQFDKLNKMKEQRFNDEANAVKRNLKLKDKNRKGSDIPGDMHRVVLHDRTEYINAVFINSYKTENRYILAQTPLPGTVEDFLYMVLQENITCIVTMDEDNVKDKTIGMYLPAANHTLKKGSMQIKAIMCKSTSSYTLRKLTVTNLKENEAQEKTVYHFQTNFWKQTENSPIDTNALIELVKDVDRTANETDVTSSIIVHCLTGAERSCLFCVVSIMIEKMDVDHVISVVNTVRQIRSRRSAAIPNLDQYIFCHQCVSTYLKSCNTYSNVI